MKVEKNHLTPEKHYAIESSELKDSADLVFYFSHRETLQNHSIYSALKKTYPNSILMGCSTGGEIAQDDVHENTAVSLAIQFEKTTLKKAFIKINNNSDFFEAGQNLALQLKDATLKGVFVLSDGLSVNGSELVNGLKSTLEDIPIMGGLAADGSQFQQTLVGIDAEPTEKSIAAIGFYGDAIRFAWGSEGGWEPFGRERIVTKSHGNILYELDGQPALTIYKSYLGKFANELPSSALLFPLRIHPPSDPKAFLVRTILGVNEEDQSMTFAGDIPEGYSAQLMSGTAKNLTDGAELSAEAIKKNLPHAHLKSNSVAIIISCIGRKLMMGPRSIDEIEAVSTILNDPNFYRAGFFSYGEISPHTYSGIPELHNQTVTIAAFTEDLS